MTQEDATVLLSRIDALTGMLACYRAGVRPSEALHKRLDSTRSAVEEIRERYGI